MEPETIVKLHQLENERDACDSLCCICVELLQRLRATEYTEYPDSLLSRASIISLRISLSMIKIVNYMRLLWISYLTV